MNKSFKTNKQTQLACFQPSSSSHLSSVGSESRCEARHGVGDPVISVAHRQTAHSTRNHLAQPIGNVVGLAPLRKDFEKTHKSISSSPAVAVNDGVERRIERLHNLFGVLNRLIAEVARVGVELLGLIKKTNQKWWREPIRFLTCFANTPTTKGWQWPTETTLL